MRIALDAMGGDHAPEAIVLGGVDAAREGIDVQLVGDQDAIRGVLEDAGGPVDNLTVVHAPQVVGMAEHAMTPIRRKPRSSIRVAFERAKEGHADAVVSFGNSGAVLASAVRVLGSSEGVSRPAFLSIWPTRDGQVLVLDVGATVDCKPEHLEQFAVMGTVVAQLAFDKRKPRIGLLSNGTEPEKGTDLVRAAWDLLDHHKGLSFHGYVEPNEIFDGVVDVVVTDGFTGNILLKGVEGAFHFLSWLTRKEARRTPRALLGGLLMQPALKKVRAQVEYRELGGGLVTGVPCTTIVGHGRSDRRAVAATLRFAHRISAGGLVERIEARLGGLGGNQ